MSLLQSSSFVILWKGVEKRRSQLLRGCDRVTDSRPTCLLCAWRDLVNGYTERLIGEGGNL